MTYRELLATMTAFATEHPQDPSLDRQVIVRIGVPNGDDDEDVYAGGLQSAVVDAGCTDDDFRLTLDADQDGDEES